MGSLGSRFLSAAAHIDRYAATRLARAACRFLVGSRLQCITGVQQLKSIPLACQICITHQRETFVVLDEHDRPLRPAILWMDERCRRLLPKIEDDLGRERIHAIIGKPLSGNLTLGKIAWIKAYEPEVFRHAAKYLDVAAYLNFRLTGFFRTGWGCADPTGLFDLQHNDWSKDIQAYLGITPLNCPKHTHLALFWEQ
jgi:sugar (pentulose or hexulose) kinase